MSKIGIIGGGPAGITAALYSIRAGMETVVICKDGGALATAEKIENFYGFPQPVTGPALAAAGFKQAQRLGVEIVTDEVVGLSLEEQFTIATADKNFVTDAVVLATGASRAKPTIPGFSDYEGKGISYCAVCDAFFFRGKDVAVLGSGAYALHEAQTLAAVALSVTVLTNGAQPTVTFPDTMRVLTQPITGLTGETTLTGIQLADTCIPAAGLFVALGVAGSADLAKKIGAEVIGANIKVDNTMCTSVPGLFAAGDCTGGLRQIAKAAYEGTVAGLTAVKWIRGV